MSTAPVASVVYGPDPYPEDEESFALVFVDRNVWQSGDEWYASYSSEEFSEIYDELLEKYGLDPLMENYLAADSQESYDALLEFLAARRSQVERP